MKDNENSTLDTVLGLAAVGVVYAFFFSGLKDLFNLCRKLSGDPKIRNWSGRISKSGEPIPDFSDMTPEQQEYMNEMWDKYG